MRDRTIREVEQMLRRALAAADKRDARALIVRARILVRTRNIEPHELDPELVALIARTRAPERPTYQPVPWAHGRPGTAFAIRDGDRVRRANRRKFTR